MRLFIHIFLCLILLIPSSAVFAFETDQFNLPPEPLADIGNEVSDFVAENIKKAFEKINQEIIFYQNCLANKTQKSLRDKCESVEKTRQRLNYLRSKNAVSKEIYKLLGTGFPPFTASGSWMESHKFAAQPARYKTGFGESIYAAFPSNYLTISETVKLYDASFGTDKIAHIFQQGYTYLRIYERALAKNLSAAAMKKAIDWGRNSEQTYYGFWASGVYSNADLAANFAGFKFYQNLTAAVKIGNETQPPILILENGLWEFSKNADFPANLLKPFVSNHLNEAWTSSVYANIFGLRSSVRKHVKKRACDEWRKLYPNLSKADYEQISSELKLWHGEVYGFKTSSKFVTIANSCFTD